MHHLLPSIYQYTIAEALASMHRIRDIKSPRLKYSLSTKHHSDGDGKNTLCWNDSPISTTIQFTAEESLGPLVDVKVACGSLSLQPMSLVTANMTDAQRIVLTELVMDHACGSHQCLLGPKVNYK